jgi:hypothetical protein
VLLVGAVGVDGVRGHEGTLTLLPGEAGSHFEETGPGGRSLGLRPLGFVVGVERVLPGGGVALTLAGENAPVELTSGRAVAFGGYRIARPRPAVADETLPGSERPIEMDVHREPAAALVLLGALLLAAGVALEVARGALASLGDRSRPAEPPLAPAAAGAALAALLASVDRGAVLAWSFGIDGSGGRAAPPGVGVLLGASLLAALGGSLLLAAAAFAGSDAAVRPAALAALRAGAALAASGAVMAAVVTALASGAPAGALLPAIAIAAAAALVLVAVRDAGPARPGDPPRTPWTTAVVLPLAVLLAVALAVVAGVVAVRRDGTYAAPAAAAAALLGLAALEPTRAKGARRFAFFVSLVAGAL